MPQYRYRARGPGGQAAAGQVEAVSANAAASQLIAQGLIPLQVTEASAEAQAENASPNPVAEFFAPKPTLVDLILFSRQMHTLTRAGVPIVRAIRGLAETHDKPVMARALSDLVAGLESGHDLASSLGRHPKLFPPLFVSLVRVGEQTGNLDAALLQLAQYLELDKEIQDQVHAALRYPVIVMVAITVAIVILNLFVIPTFASVFASFKTQLPLPTQILIASSQFFVRYWPYLLGATVLTAIGIRHYLRSPTGSAWWDRQVVRLPIIGHIVHKALLARFSRSFALCFKAGVPLIQALTIIAKAVDNQYIGGLVLGMRDGIQRGDSMTRVATATGIFTPMVLQMIAVGEETGALDELLLEVAMYYEREVAYETKGLTTAIEPILTGIIAAIVLVLALGIFLPMWNLGKAAMGKG